MKNNFPHVSHFPRITKTIVTSIACVTFATGCIINKDDDENASETTEALGMTVEATYANNGDDPHTLTGQLTYVFAHDLDDGHDHSHAVAASANDDGDEEEHEHVVYEFVAMRPEGDSNGIGGAWKAHATKIDDDNHSGDHMPMQAPIANASLVPFAGGHDDGHDDDHGHDHEDGELDAELPDMITIELHLKNDPAEATYNHYVDSYLDPDLSDSLDERTPHEHGTLKPENFFLPVAEPAASYNEDTGAVTFTIITDQEFGQHDPDEHKDDGDHDDGDHDDGDHDDGDHDDGDHDDGDGHGHSH